MEAKENYNPVPEQQKGSEIDAVESRTFGTMTEAANFFATACSRLLNINDWGNIAGMSSFRLFDQHGAEVSRTGQEGDYIRIDIPGPGPRSGDGYDWVRIEEIVHVNDGEEEFISIRVRPSAKPLAEEDSPAHFLKADATSTFIVRRQRIVVSAEEHGRNEMANTDTESIIDNGRNMLVGGAAKLGMSYPQWKLLVQGIMAPE
jgi:hypothetical protein